MFQCHSFYIVGFPGGSVVKNPPANARKDPLEKEMPTHSSIHAWEIPWTEETDELQSMDSQRVGLNLATQKQQ